MFALSGCDAVVCARNKLAESWWHLHDDHHSIDIAPFSSPSLSSKGVAVLGNEVRNAFHSCLKKHTHIHISILVATYIYISSVRLSTEPTMFAVNLTKKK